MSFTQTFLDAKQHFYDSHQHPVNVAIHHLVNISALAGVVVLFFNWKVALVIFIVAAIIPPFGHVFFEKNKPATARYPGMSIFASFAWSFENWFGFKQKKAGVNDQAPTNK